MKRARPKNLQNGYPSISDFSKPEHEKKGKNPTRVFLRMPLKRFLSPSTRLHFAPVSSSKKFFFAWTGSANRITRDLDLLGHAEASHDHIAKVWTEQSVESNVVADGLFSLTLKVPSGEAIRD